MSHWHEDKKGWAVIEQLEIHTKNPKIVAITLSSEDAKAIIKLAHDLDEGLGWYISPGQGG